MSLSFQAKAAGVGALAGLAISGFLYSSLAPMQPAAATTPAAVTTPAEPVVVLRDCTPPAVLEGEVCVTHVPAPVVAVPAAGIGANSPVPPIPAAPTGANTSSNSPAAGASS
ncbi:MAG TPA: hypothetical protein PKA99_08415, partial [Dermatophilaceae bacterium]|nr:hypothetical protein [Dermatophilaceae bacterium]